MKKKQPVYLWYLLLVGAIFLYGSSTFASPGAALLSRSEASRLNPEADVVLWNTDDYTLVVPGTFSTEKVLFGPDKNYDRYLVSENPKKLILNFNSSDIQIIDSIWSIIQVPKRNATTTVIPENAIYLGYPTSSIINQSPPERTTEDVTWQQQIQDFADAITESQLMTDLTALADFQTRNSYAQGCWDSANWLYDEFSDLGYQVTLHEHDREMGPNVIAEKTGVSIPEEVVIICGHFDSISLQPQTLAPGADDNGTGTAATLNAARILADTHFQRTLRFICFSGEEQGLRGSQAYAQNAAAADAQIVGVINLDMIGYVDQAPEDLEVIGNTASEELVDLFIDCANTYTSLPTHKVINGNITASDHAPFWNQGYHALLGIEDNPINYPYYHTIDDTVDKVTPEFMTEVTRAATATIAHLAEPMEQQVYIYEVHWDDSEGDNDGYLDPNETVNIWVKLINNASIPSGEIKLTLICLSGSQHVLINNNSATIDSLEPGERADTENQPFKLTIDASVPEFSDLTCIAAMSCDAPHSSGYIFHGTITTYEWQDDLVTYSMDNDPQWISDNDVWQWGQPQGQGGDDHGYSDPSSGSTGSNVLGTNLSGDYPANIMTTITSPVLDLTEVRHAELQFSRWLNVENPQYDRARVWIVNSDGDHQVWGNKAETTDNQWIDMQIDVAQWADGRDDVQIAFSLQTDGGWEYSGWNIDDVKIAGLAPGDPMPTPTPGSIGIDLKMNDTSLEENDPFLLTLDWWNASADDLEDVPLFVLLGIDGTYWFWPDWSLELTHDLMTLPAGSTGKDIEILSFTWPAVDGSMTGLEFISAFTSADYMEILGTFDTIQWEYL